MPMVGRATAVLTYTSTHIHVHTPFIRCPVGNGAGIELQGLSRKGQESVQSIDTGSPREQLGYQGTTRAGGLGTDIAFRIEPSQPHPKHSYRPSGL